MLERGAGGRTASFLVSPAASLRGRGSPCEPGTRPTPTLRAALPAAGAGRAPRVTPRGGQGRAGPAGPRREREAARSRAAVRWWGSREAASVRAAERGWAAWRGGGERGAPGERRELGRAWAGRCWAECCALPRSGCGMLGVRVCVSAAGPAHAAWQRPVWRCLCPPGGPGRVCSPGSWLSLGPLPAACQLSARALGRWAEALRLFGVCVCVRSPWDREPPGVPRCWGEEGGRAPFS